MFLDDILIYPKNEVEHEENLRLVLQVLRENRLYAKLINCDFYQNKVQYLVHVISKEGIVVNLENIATIMEWPTPTDALNVRYFMGLAEYYRRFIKGFSKITHLITSLQWKNTNFIWSKKCEAIFQHLKRFLTSAPILKIVDPEKDYVVCINAFIEGLGGVLTQEVNIKYFMNPKKLKEHEKNYVTHPPSLSSLISPTLPYLIFLPLHLVLPHKMHYNVVSL